MLPNGSRLSGGRLARRRKSSGRTSVPTRAHTPVPLKRSPPVSLKRLLGGRPTCSAATHPTPYASPRKAKGEQRKDDCTDVRSLTAGPSVNQGACHGEEANRVEDEESA